MKFSTSLTGDMSCAVQFSPDNTVQITADFVTTGTIQLRMKLITPDTILQEGGDDILLDQAQTLNFS